MSSPYPILDNRPIDQWKVTELKEELKRRRLTTRGLKDDLIRRLDEALRNERMSNEEEEACNKVGDTVVGEEAVDIVATVNNDEEAIHAKREGDEVLCNERMSNEEEEACNKVGDTVVGEEAVDIVATVNNDEEGIHAKREGDEALRNERMSNEEEEACDKVGDTVVGEEAVDIVATINNDEEAIHAKRVGDEEEREKLRNVGDSGKEEVTNGSGFDLEQEVKCEDAVATPIRTNVDEDISDLHQNQNGAVDDGKTVDGDTSMLHHGKVEDVESIDANESAAVVGEPVVLATSVELNVTISQSLVTGMPSTSLESLSKETQVENEDPKDPAGDAVPKVTSSNNQVSEVSPVLGSQVRSESISSESVSINEKNELKDNLNADNFNLKLEVIKPEMGQVQPSSSDVSSKGGDVSSKGGDVQPLDGTEPNEDQRSTEEMNDVNSSNVDIQRRNDSAEGGYPEKLNLDRSSGDDSMEEDVVEKHVDSINNSDEVGDKSKESDVKKESPVDVVEGGLSSKKDISTENKSHLAASSEKRKLEGVGGNQEPPKRQRRWNSETLKVPERQTSNVTPSTTPKGSFTSVPKSNFTRSNSNLSGGDASKERVVPPSPKPPTNSLRIDHFLRPFTLKALQELLAKTGTVSNFWMDHIKTHCFVMYSSVEEAIETRNALYNLQWPLNGGRLLAAEFVDPQEVKMRVEAPTQAPAAPVTTGPSTHATQPTPQPQHTPRQQVSKQQLPPAPPLPSPQQKSDQPPTARDHHRLPLPPPPSLPRKLDPPIVTLDDLFRKTRAAPRIYYLPLSEEQVAAKIAAQGRNTK